MDAFELLERLSVALAIGMVIGLERGWQARELPEGERAVGLRTLALSGLLGGVWAAIARTSGDAGYIALGLAFVVYSAVITLFRYREMVAGGTFGATTVVTTMLAFALGAFAVAGDMQVAAAAGVAVAGILALKDFLHNWLKRLSWAELRSVLVLLAMTIILLPILPNRAIDRFGAINPFELWLMTILIAALSFVGYIALKLAGERKGIVITSVAGGLTSSTAVTLTMSRLARENLEHRDTLIAGVLLAGATMFVRVLVVVGFISLPLVPRLALPLSCAAAVLVGIAVYYLGSTGARESEHQQIDLKNPFEMATVLQFGALLTIITVLARTVTNYAGSAGAYVLALVSGIVDVDAFSLSMSRLGSGELGYDVASEAILLVTAVNTVAKSVLGWIAGGQGVGVRLVVASALAIAAGSLAFWYL